ncbi:MAG: T9SS type B sorting domain-containing protein [Winogradskyella sp.]|nr:T9SS type B sorting domain-containing protein [Winogradskyella sp.]
MRHFIKLLVCFYCLQGSAQVESSNWYFGVNAGVNFNSCINEVSALLDGNVNQNSFESASISDENGNLLFYTDGETVWDKNHNPMPNANNNSPLKGKGDVIILPNPSNDEQYYIFGVDNASFWNISNYLPNNNDDGSNDGLTYSIVDLSLNNGLGDILPDQKNQHLITYNENDAAHLEYKCSEKITAVRGADCNSYWIITHFEAQFYAFLLDSNGVNTTPVTTAIAPLVPVDNELNYAFNADGKLKSSPDGKQLAIAHNSFSTEEEFYFPGGIYLYDFDNTTGIVSNPVTLYYNQETDYPYGVEYSSSGSWLYATTQERIIDGDVISKLLRWNLDANNIANTLEILEDSEDIAFGDLQLGTDDELYVAQNSYFDMSDSYRYLGIVENHNANLVLVDYLETGLELDQNQDNSNISLRNLPQFNKQWFNKRVDMIDNGINSCELFLCGNQQESLTAPEIPGATYTWYKNQQILAGENTHQLIIDDIGIYSLYLEPNNGDCPIEGNAIVLPSNDIPTATNVAVLQCDDDVSDGFSTFNLENISSDVTNTENDVEISFYDSLTDAQNEDNELPLIYTNTSNPQIIYVVVNNSANGCSNIAEVTLEVSTYTANDAILETCDTDETDGISDFDLSLANDEITSGLDEGLTISYHLTFNDALLQVSALPLLYTNSVSYFQTIYARVENENTCYRISAVQLIVNELPEIELHDEAIYCLNNFPETIMLTSGIPNNTTEDYTFEWSTGETSSSININAPGTYTVTVTNNNTCSSERTIVVQSSNIATITDINVVDATQNNLVTVLVSGEGDYEYALDTIEGPYQDENTFNNVQPGLYSIFVRDKNNCGVTEDLVSVIGFPKFFTPNNDGVNDYWQIKGINRDIQTNTSILIFNRYGKLLAEIDSRSPGWDGTYNGSKLPSNDYWFSVILEDGREFTNHFTLKR